MELRVNKEQIFEASLGDYEEFLASLVWNDLKRELNIWIVELVQNMIHESDDSENHRNQGRLQAIQLLIGLPDEIIDIIESDSTRSVVMEDEL